jgi:hypothetical protein
MGQPLLGVEVDNATDRDESSLEGAGPIGESALKIISPKRVTVIAGEFGSGKSEIALNFALGVARAGFPVSMIDLDIMKPAFRSRDAAREVVGSGVEMVVPKGSLAQFEMPAVNPRVHAALRSRDRRVLMDVTGSDAGGMVVRGFKYLFEEAQECCLLFVVNPYRPFSETPDRIAAGARVVERSSTIRPHAFISNPNFGGRTTSDDVLSGHETVRAAADLFGVSLWCLTVSDGLGVDEIERIRSKTGLAVITIRRMIKPPWTDPEEIGRS